MLTDWLMVIITAIYVIATIFICVYNGKSAAVAKRQTEEMIRQYNENNRPHITIRFDVIRNGLLCFIIENEGNQSAYNVKVRINQAFIDNINEQFAKNGLTRLNGSSFYLASKQKMTLSLGGQPKFKEIAKVKSEIIITYDSENQSYSERTEIDLEQYSFLLVYNSPLEDISQHLKKIKENEAEYQKKALKMLGKSNPPQMVIMRNADEDDGNKYRIYKEICTSESELTIREISNATGLEEEYIEKMLVDLKYVDNLVIDTISNDFKNVVWIKR